MLEKGADINSKDVLGKTSLHIAFKNGHQEIVKCLLENGANIESKEGVENTPPHLAPENSNFNIAKHLLLVKK